jgi:hypothetical protein
MTDVTADKLVLAYMNLRNAIQEHEGEVKRLKEQQTEISNKLLELCSEQGMDSLRTNHGTASRRVQSSYWTTDWERMYEFIADNDAFHLLEKRIHNSHMKEFLQDNPDKMPVGLQSETKYIISVRKPSNRSE